MKKLVLSALALFAATAVTASAEERYILETAPEHIELKSPTGDAEIWAFPTAAKHIRSWSTGAGESFDFDASPTERDCTPIYIGSLTKEITVTVSRDQASNLEITIPASDERSETLISIRCGGIPNPGAPPYLLFEIEKRKAIRELL